jgi:glycerate 2-kinase
MDAKSKTIHQMRKDALDIFSCAVKAVDPGSAVKKKCSLDKTLLTLGEHAWDIRQFDNIFVVGAGKAGAPMALALEDMLGENISGGVISVKYGHGEILKRLSVIEAGHPLPDENGRMAARGILRVAKSAGEHDLVICLISGGGSALLCLPAPGISLDDKQKTVQALLSCGATIHQINAVRKHISGIKGGRLARAAYPATIVSLILSDVVGDDPEVIASGPTVPDTSTFQTCMEIIDAYRLQSELPRSVLLHLTKGAKGEIPETPGAGEPCFTKTGHILIGSNYQATFEARRRAAELGYHCLILSTMMQGDAAQSAKIHAAVAKEIIKTGNPVPSPACILSGGEATVVIKGEGTGGRNMEFALAFAMEIADCKPVVMLSAGTDGTDGPTDAAGAVVDADTCGKASAMGLSPAKYLENNDSYHFFKAINDLFITGPTRTNVMDIRIMLVN